MASFNLLRELCSTDRDKGTKRLLIGLYEMQDGARSTRYLACSEQNKVGDDWKSAQKGITIRKSERDEIVAALQSADFDAGPDTSGLSNQQYADDFFKTPTTCTCSYTWCPTCGPHRSSS